MRPPPVSPTFEIDAAEATSVEPIPELAFALEAAEDTAPRIVAPLPAPSPPPAPRLRLPLPVEDTTKQAAPSAPFEDDTPPPAVARVRLPAPPPVSPPRESERVQLPLPAEGALAFPPAPSSPLGPAPEAVSGLGQALAKLEAPAGATGVATSRARASEFILHLADEEALEEPKGLNLRELSLLAVLLVALLGGVLWKGPSLGVVDAEERAKREAQAQQEADRRARAEAILARKQAEQARRDALDAKRALESKKAVQGEIAAEVETWVPEPPDPDQAESELSRTAPFYGYADDVDLAALKREGVKLVEPPPPPDETPASEAAPLRAPSDPSEGRARDEPEAHPPPPEPEADREAELEPPPTTPSEGARASSGLFMVMSEPPGALIEVEGTVLGKTPFVQKVARFEGRGRVPVTIKLKGHAPWKGMLAPNASGHYQLKAELEPR
jgi:hypothetical protein